MRKFLHLSALSLCGFLVAAPAGSQGRYLETSDYLRAAFSGAEPEASVLWVTKELRRSAKVELGHEIASLRVRYWERDGRTAWILEEIGKERPITIGVVVDDDAVSMVRILEFRETRGWEVKYPFFTDQFDNVRLDSRQELDHTIDSITGATMSVDAVTKVVRLALFLHRQTGASYGGSSIT